MSLYHSIVNITEFHLDPTITYSPTLPLFKILYKQYIIVSFIFKLLLVGGDLIASNFIYITITAGIVTLNVTSETAQYTRGSSKRLWRLSR